MSKEQPKLKSENENSPEKMSKMKEEKSKAVELLNVF